MARQAIGVGDRLLADGLFGDGQPAGEPSDTSSARDVANLLRWLADGHFTFLGHRYLTAIRGRLVPEGRGLGVLHDAGGPSRT